MSKERHRSNLFDFMGKNCDWILYCESSRTERDMLYIKTDGNKSKKKKVRKFLKLLRLSGYRWEIVAKFTGGNG